MQNKTPPPFMHEGRLISNQAERASILRDSLLARYQASDDLAPCELRGVARIPWSDELTEIEVRRCTTESGNTCTGADQISVDVLRACWGSIGSFVTQLFRACLQLGYHPACFKVAEVIFLSKSGRDPTTTKGWRPIALLSCLGKVLERILAKRMAPLAVK